MSKYTTQVRFICESSANLTESTGFNDIENVLDKSWSKIFSNFPIFDEKYRPELCKKILRHYYTREICCETVGRWKLFLSDKMKNIMPYYNQLYHSELLKIQPLVSVDRSVTHEGSGNETKTTNRNETNSSSSRTDGSTDTWSYYSDTPQGGIAGLDSNDYLTNATHNVGTDSTNSTLNGSTTDNETGTENRSDSYVDKVLGYEGNQSEMLLKFRETFLNIDMMIINELKDLFFTLY
nr:MAG TPA: Lower collar protein [Caudoviricetes sp.]